MSGARGTAAEGTWTSPSVTRRLTPSDLAILTGDLEHGLQVWADRRVDADDPDGPLIQELARAFADGEVEVIIVQAARPRGVEGPAEPPDVTVRSVHRRRWYAVAQTPEGRAEWLRRALEDPNPYVEIGPVEVLDRDALTGTTAVRLPDGTTRVVSDGEYLREHLREAMDGLYLAVRR